MPSAKQRVAELVERVAKSFATIGVQAVMCFLAGAGGVLRGVERGRNWHAQNGHGRGRGSAAARWSLMGTSTASAQEAPCAVLQEEVPANCGAGTISGTNGDDVIVASAGTTSCSVGADDIIGRRWQRHAGRRQGMMFSSARTRQRSLRPVEWGKARCWASGGPLAGLGGRPWRRTRRRSSSGLAVDRIAGGRRRPAFGGPLDDQSLVVGQQRSSATSQRCDQRRPRRDFIDGTTPPTRRLVAPPGGNNDTCSGGLAQHRADGGSCLAT